jgi:hypothetical protein
MHAGERHGQRPYSMQEVSGHEQALNPEITLHHEI